MSGIVPEWNQYTKTLDLPTPPYFQDPPIFQQLGFGDKFFCFHIVVIVSFCFFLNREFFMTLLSLV